MRNKTKINKEWKKGINTLNVIITKKSWKENYFSKKENFSLIYKSCEDDESEEKEITD